MNGTAGVVEARVQELGEIVVQRPDGVPDFNALQNELDRSSSNDIVYFVFDVPFFESYDLRRVQLRYRRQRLEALLQKHDTERIRLSDTFDADPASILNSARRMGLEGIIAKRADAPYVSRRTDTWLKIKCKQRQEFVICGYHDGAGTKNQVGSLIPPRLRGWETDSSRKRRNWLGFGGSDEAQGQAREARKRHATVRRRTEEARTLV